MYRFKVKGLFVSTVKIQCAEFLIEFWFYIFGSHPTGNFLIGVLLERLLYSLLCRICEIVFISKVQFKHAGNLTLNS